jgi:hypothetical protein
MQAVGRSVERHGQIVEQVFLLIVGHCAETVEECGGGGIGGGGGGGGGAGESESESAVGGGGCRDGGGRAGQSRACRQRRLTRRSARGARRPPPGS